MSHGLHWDILVVKGVPIHGIHVIQVKGHLGTQVFGYPAGKSTTIRCAIQRRFQSACADGR
jgi:hypothetical protein